MKKIFYSPYFLASIICLIIIFFLPDLSGKYKVKLLENGTVFHPNQINYFQDLDFDGYSEKITSFTNGENVHCIQVFNHDGGCIDQWNFKG
ncbi:MAG: hypothetical protein KDC05_13915, partial [Bacteroidales bacterium]|nr:hypothetical protein [Bacteroidales bacterium]